MLDNFLHEYIRLFHKIGKLSLAINGGHCKTSDHILPINIDEFRPTVKLLGGIR